MDAKQYLQQAFFIDSHIKMNLEELKNMREMSTSISTNWTQEKVQSSKQTDKIGNAVEKIIDLENTINNEIENLIDLKKEIRSAINMLSVGNERLLLRLRYLEFLTWETISERMNYSIRQIGRIHQSALAHMSIMNWGSNKIEPKY